MVRTIEHTCKDCNKDYASYQSLCNHRTKYHKNENNSIQQHDNSIEQPITAIESVDFNCRHCAKSYKHQQSRSRHEIICKKRNCAFKQAPLSKLGSEGSSKLLSLIMIDNCLLPQTTIIFHSIM